MNRPHDMRTIAAFAAAALLGWFARDLVIEETPAPVAHVAPAPAEEPSAPPVATAWIVRAETPRGSGGNRNLFAYREHAAPPRFVIAEATPPPVIATPPPAVVVQTPAETQPRFGYRLIGTFGTREKRLAAFSRDGEVLAVRTGAKIGSDFVLRSIGLESVEVQPLASSVAQRVALGQ